MIVLKTNYNSFVNISHVTRGLSGEFYDQLLTVYDVSNVPFLPNMYDISGVLTGNSIVGIAKDASSLALGFIGISIIVLD